MSLVFHMVGWIGSDGDEPRTLVSQMLRSDLQIVRRIALHVLDRQFGSLSDLFWPLVGPDLFDNALLHEFYWLLRNHFAEFDSSQQDAVVGVILSLSAGGAADDLEAERKRKRVQRTWLHAIRDQGNKTATELFQQLVKDPDLGLVSKYPDLLSYTESRSGPSPSPYTVAELLSLDSATLVGRLNTFEEPSGWNTPSVRALADTFEAAIKQAPTRFIQDLPAFLAVKPAYQYGLLSALKALWEEAPRAPESERENLSWDKTWPTLLDFCCSLVDSADFFKAVSEQLKESLTPTAEWLPPMVCDLLKAGTRSDEHAFSPELLPLARDIIIKIVENVPSEAKGSETDAVSEAINASKGRCIEALFNYALRVSRVNDKREGNHIEAWRDIEPVFDRELDLCRNDNFEFSTLCGNYFANLHYLSPAWLEKNMPGVFPDQYPRNWSCAVQGLAYMPHTSQDIFQLLFRHGVLKRAINVRITGQHAKEKVLQHIGLAYL